MNILSLLQALCNPAFLVGLITLATGSVGALVIKSCSQGSEIKQLQADLTQAKLDLSNCRINLGVIQADLTRQASEINKYNTLASQYKKELETKYTLPQVTSQPCRYDFTLMNNLLTKQGKGM